MKTSTIVVSAGESTAVFRSLKEVPPALRRRLRRSVNGAHSGVILIADKRGREQLARAMRRLPESGKGSARPARVWGPRAQQGLAVLLIVCTVLLLWAVFTDRF
jgi:hypothetical protein